MAIQLTLLDISKTMFGRIFLLVLSVLSLVWIVLVGYDLLNKKEFISPERIFTAQDGEILIVNRSEEVHLEELNFEINPQIRTVYEKLLLNVYPNEQLYSAEKRALILVAQTKVWTAEAVKNYFSLKALPVYLKENQCFELGENMEGRYKSNFLLIHPKGEQVTPGEELEWPLWDTKASASVIHLSRPLKSTNIYFRSNGTVSYQTKYGPRLSGAPSLPAGRKLDDEDLFAQVVPAKVEKYHFYEKEFALQTGMLKPESPLAAWMESGMICFEYEGTPCIISDYLKMQSPIQVLTADTEAEPDEMYFTNVQLLQDFPGSGQNGFYVGMLADKVLLSEDKTILDRILADYEIGNTLALNNEKKAQIYGRLPKKVSERYASSAETYTLTSYKNLLITTRLSEEASEVKPEKAEEQHNRSFSIPGTGEFILGNGDLVYCFTSTNQVLAYKNKKQLWRVQLEGKLIGKPKLIDLYRNGNQQLLFTVSNKIYLLNDQGGNVNDFPLSCESTAPANSYRWNNKTYFVVVNTAQQLLHIDQQGRTLKKVALKTGPVNTEVSVYRNANVLTAIVNGEIKMQSVDLDRYRILKTQNPLPTAEFALKGTQGYRFYALQGEQLTASDLQASERNIPGLSSVKLLKKMYRGEEAFLCAVNNSLVTLIFADGSTKTIETGVKEIEDADVLYTAGGTLYLAVIDGIENNIFLLDGSGKIVLHQSLEGKKNVKLTESVGKLNISTFLQNSMVQYYDILNQAKK